MGDERRDPEDRGCRAGKRECEAQRAKENSELYDAGTGHGSFEKS